jgi:hypothetical protein
MVDVNRSRQQRKETAMMINTHDGLQRVQERAVVRRSRPLLQILARSGRQDDARPAATGPGGATVTTLTSSSVPEQPATRVA